MRIMDVEHVAAAERQGLTDRLLPSEEVREAFRAGTDIILFTDRRIVTVQRSTLLAERIETTSFSYRAVRQFSAIQGDPGESRSEIKIWVGADPHPLHLRALGGADLAPLQLFLAGKLQ